MNTNSLIVDRECDVLIVGGGLSGLVVAVELGRADPNLQVLLVEANNSFGGHLMSTDLGELGAKWILPQHHKEITKLLTELHVQLIPFFNNGAGDASTAGGGGWKRIKTKGLKSFISNFELARFINEIDVVCRAYNPRKYINLH